MNLKQILFIVHMFNEKFLFMKKYLNVFSSQVIIITTIKLNIKLIYNFNIEHIFNSITNEKKMRNKQSSKSIASNKKN